ncbi:MAG: RNA 3'-terminal phosphate cyclase [Gammaproteobacteria bacterium]|nr:RNA 3'-terminal phosphate cyclase [Gammaproteobacteria bacterium]MBU1506931.1 RNA 3'-terminal phosphate cyclase [Gammaproteobacteria bacterium]MBU2121867.1 RNA 3'-terminal phosphate cyclase [Gammaproteobacteria bacterium]MBU2172886.1 RNA 3'-terminal phosphate cyclase [Gammaproteobacteria bacterium]MBU2200610.1 RNA 3'-terminal phosphate cyclase [Gammaproteobacteria bacterium]
MHSLNLDGSTGEGGGQILRTGLALAMVTGRPLQITRIRAGRPKPGLMRQHLACVQAAVAVCGGEAEGAELGSQTLQFTPGAMRAGDYRFQIATAGSCLLVLQTVLPALMLADGPSKVELSGGTHNPMAPPFDFLERAFAPLVRRLGVGLDLQLQRRGFFPAGGGELVAHITPSAQSLAPVDVLERGPLMNGWAEALVPGLARNIATRELEALGQRMGWTFEAGQLRQPATRQNEGPGNALIATLEYAHITEVFCQLGERSLSAEQVAKRLVDEVRDYQRSSGALGPHLADQWMLPLALAVWRSGQAASYTCTEVTQHTATNAQTIALGLPVKVQITPAEGAMRVEIKPMP